MFISLVRQRSVSWHCVFVVQCIDKFDWLSSVSLTTRPVSGTVFDPWSVYLWRLTKSFWKLELPARYLEPLTITPPITTLISGIWEADCFRRCLQQTWSQEEGNADLSWSVEAGLRSRSRLTALCLHNKRIGDLSGTWLHTEYVPWLHANTFISVLYTFEGNCFLSNMMVFQSIFNITSFYLVLNYSLCETAETMIRNYIYFL